MRPEIEQAITLLQREGSQSLEEVLSLLGCSCPARHGRIDRPGSRRDYRAACRHGTCSHAPGKAFRSQGTYEAGSAAPRTREIQSTEQARPARYNYSALFAELSDDRDEQIYVPVVGWLGSFKTPLVIMAPIPPALVGILPADALMGAFFTATNDCFIAGAGIIVAP